MKQTRLLEIIREEISEAVNALVTTKTGETKTMPYETPEDKAGILILKKDNNIKNIETTSGVNIKEGEKQSKYKQLAEKYQLDEDTIMEMASISQTKNALTRLGDKTGYDLVKDVEQETLDQFKKDPLIKSGRLARNLNPDEYPNKKERTIGFGAEFSKNFKKKAGIKIEDLNTDIEIRWGKKFPGSSPFKSSDFATNTSEKEAAAQVFSLEKGTQGRKPNPNKPEKPASTGKKGRPSGEPKAEKSATLTKGDDGFDTVEYSDDEGSAEAAKSAGSDETAKKLGNISTRKDKIVKAYQELQPQVKDKIAQAKAGDKESANWLKDKWTPILKAYNKAKEVKI
jgi:ssDNA-binding Zn-finger/Zn-ribbon topoisomerase 1